MQKLTKEQMQQLYDFIQMIDKKCPQGIIEGAYSIKCNDTENVDCIACWRKAIANALEIIEG